MEKKDIIYLSVFIGSFILAIIPTWKVWPIFKEKLNKSKFGRILLGTRGVRGGFSQMMYLTHILFWLIFSMIGVLIVSFMLH